jgi:hypothetical protein
MRIASLCLLTAAALTFGCPAYAGTPYEETVTCPVGGEKFEHTYTGSYSTFGSRPDGKPYGSWTFPMPLAVCPKNKLPIYDEFSKEEVAKLQPLVGSEEFRRIASANTPYFTAAWLMERTGRPANDIAWMILQASWEADRDAALKRRYQEDYVARITALPKGEKLSDWLVFQARAANGMRELGRFADSVALIDRIKPEAQLALEAAKRNAKSAKPDNEEVESAQYLLAFLDKLRRAADGRNPSSEPLMLIPVMAAQYKCKEGRDGLTAQDKADCAALPQDRS